MPTELIIVQDLTVHAQQTVDEAVTLPEPELKPLASAYYRHQAASQQNFAGISGYLNNQPFILMTHGDEHSGARAQQIFLRLLVDRLPSFIKRYAEEAEREAVEKQFVAELVELSRSVLNFNASLSMLVTYLSDKGKTYIFSFGSGGVASIIDHPQYGRNYMTTFGKLAFVNREELAGLEMRCNRVAQKDKDYLYACCGEIQGDKHLTSAPADEIQTYFCMGLAPLPEAETDEKLKLFFAAMQQCPQRERSYSLNGKRVSFFSQSCQAMADLESIKQRAKLLAGVDVILTLKQVEGHQRELEEISQRYRQAYPMQLHYLSDVVLIAARFRYCDLTQKHRQRGCMFHWDTYDEAIDAAKLNYESFLENKGEMSWQVQQLWHASLFRLFENLYILVQYADDKEDFWYQQRHAFVKRNAQWCPWSVGGWFKDSYHRCYKEAVDSLSDKARTLFGCLRDLQKELAADWQTLALVKRWQRYDSVEDCLFDFPPLKLS